MHTDGALLADNRLTDVVDTGIYVMTGPERNAIVGNEVRARRPGPTSAAPIRTSPRTSSKPPTSG